jgi:selenocysteine-specific elongation factor
MRRLILGTAGHIDHGKTALVAELTGVDTDRLKEEKERGITIDLGFAELALDDEIRFGLVDVPGHEGFIRNMLAGATGMDLVLLVVAADEGVMPQTREHLAILRLLDVSSMVVALTKCDLVEEEWLELVRGEVGELLEGTPYRDAPIVATSAKDGRGLDELRRTLAEAGRRARARHPGDHCRIPIDRVFTVRGTGTVITGTMWSGHLKRHDRVRILPGDVPGRVRGLQAHGREAAEVGAGERVAVALAGSEVDHRTVVRGQNVVTGDGWRETTMVTARVRLLPDSSWHLEARRRVRVHLGTAESMARVVLLDRRRLDPGEECWAQLRLESAIVARARDRFILRSYSPVTTIGGGVVAEPLPRKRKRLDPGEARDLDTILSGDVGSAVRAALRTASWQGIPRPDLPVWVGALPDQVAEVIADADDIVSSGPVLFSSETAGGAGQTILGAVEDYHRRHPLRRGMPVQLVRQALPGWSHPDLADSVLSLLARDGDLEILQGTAALPGFRPRLDEDQSRARDALMHLFREAGLAAPFLGELPSRLGERPDLRSILAHLVDEGDLRMVDDELYVCGEALDAGARRIRERLGGRSGLGPADFREVLPLTRRHLLPILGHYDAIGVTLRRADGREVEHAPDR